ncbi:response regulator [Paenibacillus caseinilyticus]|uniref:AraC family transcriptional regulator n=1 Tax=Paenibacillus mucilaginosus K02 TaxID=997761 RepID=I0BM01_9BACL|nr:response regulator [Paenibacillus mucilaginosus]AFH63398.1 AraC family transcriptional regulator [Paenibacillus mucilaginosus K02]
MNLMIVEDEVGIRTRIAETIPWEAHGIEVVGLAENGVEALRLMECAQPDIVILDIQMPEMDGLTLARRIADSDPGIKMIILSGYEDFEYARSAMESGVLKYLIKPAGNEEIRAAVLEAASLVQRELQERLSREALQRRWESHLPRLRELFLGQWLAGAYSRWEIERRMTELLIEMKPGRLLAVAVLEPDPLVAGEERFRDGDSALLRFSLRSIAGEVVQDRETSIIQDLHGATVILLQSTEEEPQGDFQLRAGFTVTKVLSTMKDCLKITASAGISRTTADWEKLPVLYDQARKALQLRVVYGHHIAIPYGEEREGQDPLMPAPSDERDLEIGIGTGDTQKAEAALDRLLQDTVHQAATVEEVQDGLLLVMHTLLRIVRTLNWPLREAAGEDIVYFHDVGQLQTREQIRSCLQRIVGRLTAYAVRRTQPGSHKLIQKLLSLIEEEIGQQEISLHSIAGRFYVNKSYLSRLFKHEVGEPFSQYVLRRKMIRAKQVLAEGGQVQQAAQQVGYANIGFFSKVFHKYWGVLPSEVKGAPWTS